MRFPQARQAVQRMKAYTPPLEGRRSKIRLDFNENTVGFDYRLPGFEPTYLTAYPEYQELLEGLARYLELPEEYLLLTNGSDEGIFVAAFTFIEADRDAAVVNAPTFSLIPHYLQVCQAQIREVLVHPDLTFDLERLEEALEGAKMAIMASPDNPTGSTVPLDRLERWLRRYPETVILIDEAYHEYHGQSALRLVLEYPNLIVSRTFSKAWGMAGLRLGFLAAHPQLVEWMRRVRSPYSVNTVAAKTLLGFLPRAAEVDRQAGEVVERKARVVDAVRAMGYQVSAGAANFFLVWAGCTGKAIQNFMADHGVLVRDRSSLPRMAGSVRVSVGSEDEMARFCELLRDFGRRWGILFDLDDTLVDTSRSYDACVLELSGASREELQALRAEGGFNDDWEAAAELLRRAGRARPLEEIRREGTQLYLRLAPQVETTLFEAALLEELAGRHPLFVFTGRPRAEYQPIWGERIPHLADVVCKDECARPKPAPDGLVALMEKHKLVGGMYVGNSVDDMLAARAAGLLAVGVTVNQSAETLRGAGAEVVLSELRELKGLLML